MFLVSVESEVFFFGSGWRKWHRENHTAEDPAGGAGNNQRSPAGQQVCVCVCVYPWMFMWFSIY